MPLTLNQKRIGENPLKLFIIRSFCFILFFSFALLLIDIVVVVFFFFIVERPEYTAVKAVKELKGQDNICRHSSYSHSLFILFLLLQGE